MSEPIPKNNEVLQRFYSTLERIVLFFAFDFTIDWKQPLNIFNRPQTQNQIVSKADYSKLRKKCIHKPTVPPRSSPRKHVRGKIQTYDEPKVEAQKKSSVVEMVKNGTSKSKKHAKNADRIQASVEISKIETVSTSVKNVAEENGANLDTDENAQNVIPEEVETSNPFTMLLQPIINLWSNQEQEEEEMTDFNNPVDSDQCSGTIDLNNVNNDENLKNNQVQKTPPTSEMDILEEALNESPEKFIDTILAMNNHASSTSVGEISGKPVINESFGQQLLAEAGAQLMQHEPKPFNNNIEYSTQKEEKISNNICINRTTTFHLEPANFPLKL